MNVNIRIRVNGNEAENYDPSEAVIEWTADGRTRSDAKDFGTEGVLYDENTRLHVSQDKFLPDTLRAPCCRAR